MALDLSTPCVLWEGRLDRYGYARIGMRKMHRVVYEANYGPAPAGYGIGHACHDADLTCPGGVTCSHRACINLLHLVAQTWSENARGGVWGRRTECAHGHSYDKANTYISPDGKRHCRTCNREQVRQYSQRRKAKRRAA